MKKLITIMFGLSLFVACNSENKTAEENKEKEQVEKSSAIKENQPTVDNDSDSAYTWTGNERKQFLKDCERESEENITKGKLKDFCNCLLTEAQKYYSSYKQMDQKSDENHDEEIFKKCLGDFGEDID